MTGTVVITGARAPVALHLVRLFGQAGYRVVLADSLAHPVSRASRFVDHYVRLPAPRTAFVAYAAALRDLCDTERPLMVIPTCEEVFYLAQIDDIPVFAPDFDLLAQVHNKATFIKMVAAMGLPVPETRVLTGPTDIADADVYVFKPVWSRFATQVLIPPHGRKLRQIAPTPDAPWVAQTYLKGQEICVYAVAVKGRIVASAAYVSIYRAGPGAGIFLQPVTDPAATAFVARFVAETAWTGQISFDMIHQNNGQVLPLECNPRATSGVHFFDDGPAFVAALTGGKAVLPLVKAPATVTLAMWVYALPAAVFTGRLRTWRRDMARADDVLQWRDDPAPARAQLRALCEIAGLAIRQRVTLQAASTQDIEWNGPRCD